MTRGIFKGIHLYILPEFHLYLIYRNIEPDFQRILKKYISEGDTVFDVGANIGYVSIALSKLVGDYGRVFSFEAVPNTSLNFLENIKLNNCSNISLTQKALSDENKLVTFRIPDSGINHSTASMVWHKKEQNTINIEVESIVLDEDIDLRCLSPSFIKIDVEGLDHLALYGMKKCIKKNYPVFLIEYNFSNFGKIYDFLKIYYECYFFDFKINKLLKIKKRQLTNLQNGKVMENKFNKNSVNVFFIKKSKIIL